MLEKFEKNLCQIEKTICKLMEGGTKRYIESKIEKACKCEGGASLDPADHESSCPAYKMLQDGDYGSDEIDRAEYQFGGDR